MSTWEMANKQSEMIKELIKENERLRRENYLLEEVGEYGFAKFLQITVVLSIALIISIAFNIWG